jgi:hypothetical protein
MVASGRYWRQKKKKTLNVSSAVSLRSLPEKLYVRPRRRLGPSSKGKAHCNKKDFFVRKLFQQSARLPDGLFSYQKYQFGQILEGLGMENADLFCGHLE